MSDQEQASKDNLGEHAANAAKWSTVTQMAMKLIAPVTTMILARLLTPESFGIVAAATMVVSLADLVSDAGFQSYIVQHRFDDDDEKSLCASVAFWTNLAISLAIVALVVAIREPLTRFIGADGYGNALALASLALPITSLVSVQTALFRKDFEFKALFGAGVGYSVVNLVVAVGLALLGFDYWSMIVGALLATAFRAAWLTARSSWRPQLRYSFARLRSMFSYGIWILGESAATWVNMWAGTFVIGNRMDSKSVGYYKTSTTISQGIVGAITGALMPVAFSALSAVQDDDRRFERIFMKMQGYLALCVVPIGMGCFVYRRSLTLLALGEQWLETSMFLGLWMLAGCIVVVFGYMCSEAYRAKGMPRLCVIVQVAYLLPFLPALYVGSGFGYDALTYVLPAVRLTLPCINLLVMRIFIGISPWAMLKNCTWYYLLAFIAMVPGIAATLLTNSLVAESAALVASVAIYVALLLAVRPTRKVVGELLERFGLERLLPRKFRAR